MSGFRAWLGTRRNWWLSPELSGRVLDGASRSSPAPNRGGHNVDGISEVDSIREVREVGDTTVVRLAGDVDMRAMPEVHTALARLCERRPPRLVINLQEVAYMDSSGLGMLIELFRRVRGYGGRIVLCCVSERVLGLFQITRLDKFFPLCTTEAEALTG